MTLTRVFLLSALLFSVPALRPLPAQGEVPSTGSQDAFFAHLEALCGRAFEGKVVADIGGDGSFSGRRLVMHVWKVQDRALYIPFHVGEDRSRTWIIRKTGSGLQLKHDHRHQDGSPDKSTMYGGHTTDAGWANAQSFPADACSKELFINTQMPQAVGNTWHVTIYPGKTFTYRLTREGREMRVEFDLGNPVAPPPLPWGHAR